MDLSLLSETSPFTVKRFVRFADHFFLVVSFVTNRLVPESIRWLMTHGRIAQAEKLLKRVAKVNKKEMPDEGLALPEDQKSTQREAGFRDLFGSRAMAKKTVISWISW